MQTVDPERWRAVSAELDRILELPDDQRPPYLASLQSRDAALAADVEQFLGDHRALVAEGFLNDPTAGVPAEVLETQSCEQQESSAPAGRPLDPDTRLGPYRIVRQLGRGGMGTVYEADEIDGGRRVALKVLEERLHDERERERFDREGRLAASINHPHCVFVFAASELDGRLAIAMELMEGTLADRLKAHGPLPVSSAVDAALQLVSGLKAASALGILHRDVKPSNCFVDAGVVKIGDFGISRSLRPTEETAFSTQTGFAATPAYASPEQLRNGELDTRADIYSLGATLYELLTGRRPFERPDLMALLMAVANDTPRAPHAIEPAVPRGLSQVVLRCLAKKPDQRYATYEGLAAALAPYSSRAATPATFGRRCLAGVTDHFLVMPLGLAFGFLSTGSFVALERALMWRQWLVSYLVLLLYFGISEGVWARTPGKALFRLTLIDRNGRPPRALQVIARAAMYVSVWNIGPLILLLWGPVDPISRIRESAGPWPIFFSSVFPWLLIATIFSTARRRNGYAGLHDLTSRTRIVEYRFYTASAPRTAQQTPALGNSTAVARLGPFQVLDRASFIVPPDWRPGFDERLSRAVWIREAPPGTSPLDPARLAVNRPTRLRWLAGRREPDAAWDVFEAVPGVPLEHACARARAWVDVRWWLLDLARECTAQLPDDKPPLRADRVWILESGGAKLVDDPAADRADGSAVPGRRVSCAPLLLDVVRTARASDLRPWPLSAHRFVEQLADEPHLDNAAIAEALEPLTRRRAVLTRGWRGLSIGVLAALPVLISAFWTLAFAYAEAQFRRMPVDVRVAVEGLGRLRRAESGRLTLSRQDREAVELALATSYRPALARFKRFPLEYFPWVLPPDNMQIAERLLLTQPTEAEGRGANDHPAVQALVREASKPPDLPPLGVVAISMLGGFFLLAAVCSLVAALTFRGGVIRILGLELVTTDGRPASRLRVVGRTLLTWLPLLLGLMAVLAARAIGVPIPGFIVFTSGMGLGLLVTLAAAIFAVARPERGIQDRLAGTWIVPR